MSFRAARLLWATMTLLVLSTTASAAPPEKPSAKPESQVLASKSELEAMEKEQAARSSKFGGALVSKRYGTFEKDGKTWETISDADLVVVDLTMARESCYVRASMKSSTPTRIPAEPGSHSWFPRTASSAMLPTESDIRRLESRLGGRIPDRVRQILLTQPRGEVLYEGFDHCIILFGYNSVEPRLRGLEGDYGALAAG